MTLKVSESEIRFCGKRVDTNELVYGYVTKMWG